MANQDYSDLKEKLEANTEWPRVYLFKFIVPSNNKKLALVEALFGAEAEVSLKQSRKGNYVSVSAKELMLNSDGIINRYKRASKIEGLMAL
jgi:putative lipoic acid-binding regulatory protein